MAENVKSKDSSQQASGGEHKNWLSGSGSLGMTGAKDSTALGPMRDLVRDPLYSRI